MSGKLPAEIRKALEDPALVSQPEDLVADCYNKFSPAQKERYIKVVETIQTTYENQLDPVQTAMAALAVVIFNVALAHFMDVIAGGDIRDMADSEVEALEFARKFYNENFNNTVKQAAGGQRESNFLRDLDEFRMKRLADGSIEVTGKKAAPKLKVPVIDTEVSQGAASPQHSAGEAATTDDSLVL